MSGIQNYEHIDFGKNKSIIENYRKKNYNFYKLFGIELILVVVTSLLMGKADNLYEYFGASACAGIFLWLKFRDENKNTLEKEKQQLQLNNDNYLLQTSNRIFKGINDKNKNNLFIYISQYLAESIDHVCDYRKKESILQNIRIRIYAIETNNDYTLLSNYSTNPKYNYTKSINRRYEYKFCTILNKAANAQSYKKYDIKIRQPKESNLKINDFSTYTLPIGVGVKTHIIIIESDIAIKDYYIILDYVLEEELNLISRIISNYEII